MARLEERELTAILAAEKRDALSADQASRLSEERERAMDYYNGDMSRDMPAQPDRSKAVSMDVYDTVEGLMPGLMEIFCSGDEVVRFNPTSEEDEELAAQETDYINHVFLQKNEGFVVSYTFVKDALISKNGVVKIYWEEKEDEERETFYNQPDDVYALFVADPEIEIVEHSEHPPEAPPPLPIGPAPIPGTGTEPPVGLGGLPPGGPPGPPGGPGMPPAGPPGMNGGIPPDMQATGPVQAPPIAMGEPEPPAPPPLYGPTHDFTIVKKRKYGCCKIEPVPPEEFGVSRRARLGQPLDYSYHQVQRTVAELIAMGFDEDQLEDLPDSPPDENTESIARDTVEDDKTYSSSINKATRLITVTEHYATLDYEGDGPRLYRVTTAGAADGQVLKRDGEPDIIPVEFDPFASMTPVIMPHRFFGKGVPDQVSDIQRIKTALYRGGLDNVYLANNQRLEIAESHAGQNTIDDLLNNRPGGLVRTKQPGGLIPIPNQNLGEYVFPMLEYMDTTREWRTGVVRQGQGIDADALQNQSATAVQKVYNASQAKQKLTARVMAEVGFRQMFWKIHATVRKHESSTQTVKLRGKWTTVDPRQWKKRDDLTISVGLGSGGKAEQTAFWMAILGIQKEALALPGQNIVSPQNIYAVLEKLMAAGGEKSIEPYFSDPSDPENPPGEPQPDPKMIEMQGKLALQRQEVKADQQKMTAEVKIKEIEAEGRRELERLQAEADVAANDRKIQADIALAEKKFALDRTLAIEKFNMDMQIAAAKAKQQQTSSAVSISSNGEKVQVTHDAGEIMGPVIDAVGKLGEAQARAQQETTNAIMQAIAGMGQSMAASMNAPKRVVRGPDGRVAGVEPVMNGAG